MQGARGGGAGGGMRQAGAGLYVNQSLPIRAVFCEMFSGHWAFPPFPFGSFSPKLWLGAFLSALFFVRCCLCALSRICGFPSAFCFVRFCLLSIRAVCWLFLSTGSVCVLCVPPVRVVSPVPAVACLVVLGGVWMRCLALPPPSLWGFGRKILRDFCGDFFWVLRGGVCMWFWCCAAAVLKEALRWN